MRGSRGWSETRRRLFSTQAIIVVAIAAITVAVVRLLWAAGSSPSMVATFIKADFFQATAAAFTALATVALWTVTSKLARVTSVQVHATTAPLIFARLFVHHDPAVSDADTQVKLNVYEWSKEDGATPEVNIFHRDHELKIAEWEHETAGTENSSAAPASTVQAKPPSRYIVVLIFNAQAQSAYGFATDIEVDTILKFPRYSTVKAANPTTITSADSFYELPRTLKISSLAGQASLAIAAYRVDEIPHWTITVEQIRYRDFQGRPRTFAVGSVGGNFNEQYGLSVRQGRWKALRGELPV